MRNKKIKQIIILALPLLLKYVFFFVFVDWRVFDSEDIKEDVIFFGLIALLIQTKLFQKHFFKTLLLFVYLLYIVLETTSYLAVSSTFSSSYMYLLLESSSAELKEFAGGYFSWPILLVFLINIFFFFRLRKIAWNADYKQSNLLGLSGFAIIIFVLKFTGLIESNAYHNAVRGSYGYYKLQKNMQLASAINKSDVKVTSDNEVLVLVLGESTDRNHMQIYGYNRQTTPNLNVLKDELYVFDNVISTEVFTLKAVPKILTSLNHNSNGEDLVDIVQVFKTAGYDTYWLSNQRPISFHDNAISNIASGSKTFQFYNHQIDRDAKVLDEALLPDYSEILKKEGKKLIVLRLIGTHFDYINRYPYAFEKFKSVDASKKEKLIDEYDNAILYNDFILNKIISELKAQNQKSALLYISDHGENIYDYGTDFFGRSEEVITKNMFEIPFLFWASESFNYPDDFEYQKNRAFTSQFTYESLGHIFGVMHTNMNAEKSIFSNSYKQKKRIIVGDKDFDIYFKKKSNE